MFRIRIRSRVGSRKVGICPAVGLKNLSSVVGVRVRSSVPVIGAGHRCYIRYLDICNTCNMYMRVGMLCYDVTYLFFDSLHIA